MARRRRRRRGGHRTRLHRPGAADAADDLGPPPLDHVRAALDEPHPLTLLAVASSMLHVLEPARPAPVPIADDEDARDLPSVPELAASFIQIDTVETTALLGVFAELIDDDVLARRMRRAVAGRTHRMPSWLTGLTPIEVHTAVALSHVLGDGDNVMLGVRTAVGDELTVAVYIDHNLGTVVKDAFVIGESLEAVVEEFAAAADDPDVASHELGPADARARIDAAMELAAITWPPLETDTWPACRPLVRWVLRHLPPGGQGYVRPEWSDHDRAELTERFFASRFGRVEDDADGRSLFESLLWFGCDYGPGDPLRWSPVAVEILLTDWLPRKVVADVAFLSRAPDLLRAFVRFSHEERGIRDELTAETLAAIDDLEDGYQEVIRSLRPQGPAALMAAMGVPVGDGPFGTDIAPWWADASYEELAFDSLARAVGGRAQLEVLDRAALPDEAFAWDVVSDDVIDRVRDVLTLTDQCCDELLDVEYRTACRRLLADVAAADPQIFRRRGRAETAAAAIAWIVGKANRLFDTHRTNVAVADVVGWFGVSGSPSQRAATMLTALGVDDASAYSMDLGTPRYLVSERRRDLSQRRDALQTARSRTTSTAPDDDDPRAVLSDAVHGGELADLLAERRTTGATAATSEPVGGDLTSLDASHPDPAPNRTTDVATAVGWFPPDQFTVARERWPELAQRWASDDHTAYARGIQGHLLDLSRAAGRNPQVVPLVVDELDAYAEEHGTDPGAPETRAAFAADAARGGRGVAWPPRRNAPCWCGSGRKYKKCCDTVPADPAQRRTVGTYEFDVRLAGVSPSVWRRFRLDASGTFADLHHAIQDACGWEDAHLFRFTTPDGAAIAGSAFDGGFGDVEPAAHTVPLGHHFAAQDRCIYEYDLGDSWIHDVTVVDRTAAPATFARQLVDGGRAFPPEDCGGLPGYEQCVALATGRDDLGGRFGPHGPGDLREWLGEWDPEAFDREQIARWFDQRR
ncbi:MAG TPA: DUF6398 domain-containing protein [Euzebyales bacterium]|nr:DUF6398 domain-containing protein [Euzebyales bacterium]